MKAEPRVNQRYRGRGTTGRFKKRITRVQGPNGTLQKAKPVALPAELAATTLPLGPTVAPSPPKAIAIQSTVVLRTQSGLDSKAESKAAFMTDSK